MATLSARHLTIAFGEKTIIDDISFVAEPGQVTGLIGPNGAGKSTVLSAISGDLNPRHITSGTITIGDEPVDKLSSLELARRRAVMLQDVTVSFSFLVRDVVAMGRRPWARTSRSKNDEAIIDAALRATGVDHLSDRDVTTLSGGERARVALARVIAQQTPVILLDEPTAALDIAHQEQAFSLVRRLARKGATVVVVVHDLNAAAAYCDRIICLKDAKIAAYGPVDAVYTESTLSRIYGWPISVHPPHHEGEPIQISPSRNTLRSPPAVDALVDLIDYEPLKEGYRDG